jgi:glycosyltransferase involved in cell wall biosynthesis
MANAAVHDSTVSPAQAGAATAGARRILIFRSCRPDRFMAAVRAIRERQPASEIVALSHRGHRDVLNAAGVDTIIEVPGRRFGVFHLAPWTLVRLRASRFDEIVIPQMTALGSAHANLYGLAHALRPGQIVILPGDEPPWVFSRDTFRPFALRQAVAALVAVLDVPLLIALLSVACLVRRPRPVARRVRRRVLHVISSLSVGGAQRQLAELVNRTPAADYEIEILVLGRADGEFSRAWLARDDVRVTYLAQWPQLTASVLEVREFCRRGQFHLVHTWLFMANVIGAAGARLAGVPRVISSVRNLSLWKRTWYRRWWFRLADALASRAADVVTVNAQALAPDHAAWTRMPTRRIEVIHNGVDPTPFEVDRRDARRELRVAAELPADAWIVGITGRLAVEKDHKTFLRVIREVRRTHPQVRGVIVGDGVMRGELESAAAESGIAESVRFRGERQDAPRLMAGFDLFLLTSIIEGFPNVLLEAAFLGVPAVASRVGGITDVLPDPAVTFEPGDHVAAARAVAALIADPARASAHAHETRQRALDLFTADRMVAAWSALYDRCLSEESPA